tara:strand:- start:7143 stop:7925 length:783 start_codon:yes stop_codon:yes gene_type:complete
MYSKIVLSIGGSDSGGGAGIQADLRTFMSLKVHGCTAITCITAQNSLEVTCVEAVQANTLKNQIDTLFTDFPIQSLKTGMLLNENIIINTAKKLKEYSVFKVIDPVMVSRTGSKLIEDNAINAYKKLLFPQAEIVTPNIFEANLLSNIQIRNENDIEKSAQTILRLGPKAVLIKGGGLSHLKGKDFYIDKTGKRNWLTHKFVNTSNTHGSGCTLSAAISSYLALGFNLIESIKNAKLFIERSLDKSYKIGSGPGPLGHYQ